MKAARKTIPAGQFKAQCLGLLDQVQANQETIVVTKHGKPVAQLVPVDPIEPAPLNGSVCYHDDIVGPTGEEWDSNQ